MKKCLHSPHTGKRLLAFCYAGVFTAYLALCAFTFLQHSLWRRGGQLPYMQLGLGNFASSGIRHWNEDGLFSTTDPDPQLVYTLPDGLRISQFIFYGMPQNKGGGEMALYYTTAPQQPFSEGRKLWAQQGENGAWVFSLAGRRIYSLRFDVDAVGGVLWRTQGFSINAPQPLAGYFIPDVLGTAFLLVFPLFLWALLCQVLAFMHPRPGGAQPGMPASK